MNFGTFAGGLGAAYGGFVQGEKDTIEHENAMADQDWAKSQRQFAQDQQARTVAQQARDDQLRADNQNTPAVGSQIAPTPSADGGSDDVTNPSSKDAQNGMDVGGESPATPAPVPKFVTQDQHLRAVANNFLKAGDAETGLKLSAQADQMALQRSSREYQTVAAGADSMSLPDLANASAKVFNDDMFPGKVTGVQDLGPNGVQLTLQNTATGEGLTRVFKSKGELLQAMQARYSPETFATIQAQNAKIAMERQAKIDEEAAKTQIIPGGASALRPDGTVYHNAKEFRPPAAVAPDAAVQKYVTEYGTKGGTKLEPEQLATASDYANHLFTTNPGMPAPMAGRLGVSLALHPDMVHVGFNPDTGTIDQLVADPQTGSKFALQKNVVAPTADPKSLPTGTKPEDIAADLTKMVGKYNAAAAGLGDLYVQAANDPSKLPALQAALPTYIKHQLATDPRTAARFAQATPEQQQQAVATGMQQDAGAVQSRLAALSTYLPKPGQSAAGSPAAAPAPRAPIPANTPPEVAASIQKAREVDDAAAAAKAKDAADKVTAASANKARQDQLRQEASWLSLDHGTDSLTPVQAREYMDKYAEVLPDRTRQILQLKATRGLGLGPTAMKRL